MTTKSSPLPILKDQADRIAAMLRLKSAQPQPKENFKFGIAMDDKVLSVEMTWTMVRDTSEAALSEFILRYMQESGDVVH